MTPLAILLTGPGGMPVTHVFHQSRVSIGRAPDNDLSLQGPPGRSSHHHALIEWKSGGPRITDLGSTHGTTVNGTRIKAGASLSPGDHVVLGGGAGFHVYWAEDESWVVPRKAAGRGLFPLAYSRNLTQRFHTFGKMAEGRHGSLWLAESADEEGPAVIKVLCLDQAISGTAEEIAAHHHRQVERFRREGEILSALGREPGVHIVRARETGWESSGIYYIIMDHVDGASLREIILERHPLPGHLLVGWFYDIARALDAAHRFRIGGEGAQGVGSRGIIHRDVRPSNILIERGTNRALLCDFGIAALLEGGLHLTQPQDRLSHLHHTPPEAFFERHVNTALDLWGLAVTFHLAASGMVFPFEGRRAELLHQNIRSGRMRRLAKARYDLHPDIIELVEASLRFDPAERPTMEDWLRTLRRHHRGADGAV